VGAASATTITYTSYTIPIGDQILITNPHQVGGKAGQIDLNGVTGLPGVTTILAWQSP
jgi:hypothetical protein